METMTTLQIREFLDLTASDAPAPGGGSVAALAAGLGSALGNMVIALSVGKKSFEVLPEEIKTRISAHQTTLQALREKFLDLIDRDTEAFNGFMAALKMPKTTEEEKVARYTAMAQASKDATKVPMETARLCVELMSCLPDIVQYGNKNAVTDAGVAALLARAACEAAIFNVKINLGGIADEAFIQEAEASCDAWLKQAEEGNRTVVAAVYSKL